MNIKILVVLCCFSFLGGCTSNKPPKDVYKLTSDKGWEAEVKPEDVKNYIPWEEAIDLLYSGKVKTIAQGHDLQVRLFLSAQEFYSTIEPDIDTIFLVIERCGKQCKNIGKITE